MPADLARRYRGVESPAVAGFRDRNTLERAPPHTLHPPSATIFAPMASPCSTTDPQRFLPTTMAECKARGWDAVDVVFVSGDAYLDHPSFAAALLGRVLEAEGFRVAILPQPAWRDASAFREFGRPRLCFAVSAGNMARTHLRICGRRL